MVQMVVDHRRQQIVGRADGMNVAGQVQIELLHRHHLTIATTGSSSFDAKGRPHRRLADSHHCPMPALRQRLAKADGGGGFSFS